MCMCTFDLVHQCDDFLGEGPGVRGILPVRARVLEHRQEVQALPADVNQV